MQLTYVELRNYPRTKLRLALVGEIPIVEEIRSGGYDQVFQIAVYSPCELFLENFSATVQVGYKHVKPYLVPLENLKTDPTLLLELLKAALLEENITLKDCIVRVMDYGASIKYKDMLLGVEQGNLYSLPYSNVHLNRIYAKAYDLMLDLHKLIANDLAFDIAEKPIFSVQYEVTYLVKEGEFWIRKKANFSYTDKVREGVVRNSFRNRFKDSETEIIKIRYC